MLVSREGVPQLSNVSHGTGRVLETHEVLDGEGDDRITLGHGV